MTNPYDSIHPIERQQEVPGNDTFIIDGKTVTAMKLEYIKHDGLTKREYFAAMAMQGLLSAGRQDIELAVNYADELINELNKTEPQ